MFCAHPLAHPHVHPNTPGTSEGAHSGASGRQGGARAQGSRRAPRGQLSACPSARGSAVVNDAFDGGRICCARSERAPIICFPEGSELPPPCEPRRGSRPQGKLLLGSGVHCPAPGQRLAASRAGPRGSSSSGAALLDTEDRPRGRGVFKKQSRDAKQARGFAAISFYALTNSKLKAGKREGRTETASPGQTARGAASRTSEHRGRSPAQPAPEARHPRPRAPAHGPGALYPGGRRPPLPPSELPRSPGPARPSGAEREAQRAATASGSLRA